MLDTDHIPPSVVFDQPEALEGIENELDSRCYVVRVTLIVRLHPLNLDGKPLERRYTARSVLSGYEPTDPVLDVCFFALVEVKTL